MQEINDNMKDRNYRKISATERNQNKLLTVVYYIPKQSYYKVKIYL